MHLIEQRDKKDKKTLKKHNFFIELIDKKKDLLRNTYTKNLF